MAELTATDPTVTDPVSSSCCSTEAQSTCCEPSEKSDCCGPEATASGGCGCSAGADAPVTADVRETVREKYAAAARQVAEQGSSCCGPVELTDGDQTEVFGSTLYDGCGDRGCDRGRGRGVVGVRGADRGR